MDDLAHARDARLGRRRGLSRGEVRQAVESARPWWARVAQLLPTLLGAAAIQHAGIGVTWAFGAAVLGWLVAVVATDVVVSSCEVRWHARRALRG